MHARMLLTAAVGTAVVALALGGCTGTPAQTSSADSPVTLTYWSGFTGGDKQAYEDLIQKFNDSHKNIKIDYVLQPWDSIAQKLPTSIAAGSGPDLATPDYNVATILQYAANGLALPLTDLIGPGDTQVPAGVLPKTIADSFTVDGKLYAAPANFATLMLYYNKDLLKAAGIDTPPTTMAELQADSVKLTGGGRYGIALADNASIAMWPIVVWAEGGDIVSDGCSALDNPGTISAVSTWSGLVRDKKVSPLGLSGQDADNLFAAGKAAFEINGPWAGAAYKKAGINFGLAPVPVGASGTAVTLASTVPTIVSAQTKHPKEAQEFLAWWMSKDTQAQLSTSAAYAPSRTDMADNAAIAADPTVAAFTAQVPGARLFLPTEKDFSKINEIFFTAIQTATQKGDAPAALAAAHTQLNQLLGCSK